MCVGEIFEECFSNWLGWIRGKKDALPPTEIMDGTMHEDDPEITILDEVYNWLVHPKGKKERKEYHVYMAWVSIVALLKNQFYPVTMHEMRELYAEHHKTVSKAFNEMYDENIMNDSRYEWLDWQLFRICSVANTFQRRHPELQGKMFRTRKNLMNIRILGEKYSDEEYDDYLNSEYDYDSEFIDPNSDTEDEDSNIDTIQHVSVQPIIDTLTNAIKGDRIQEPTEPCEYEKDPVKAMLHDITEWLVNKEYYDYHIYRIWYVTRVLINNNFHTFNDTSFIYQDWRHHKTDMTRCFGRYYDLYDPEDNREFYEINRIHTVLIQFQVKWSCLKNVNFDPIPLFLQPPPCQITYTNNSTSKDINISDNEMLYFKNKEELIDMFLDPIRTQKCSVAIPQEKIKQFKELVKLLNEINEKL